MTRRPDTSEDSALHPTVVGNDRELAVLLEDLRAQHTIAVDTESNSLHAYRERVCLVQFSTQTRDYLVDPLSVLDLSSLAPIFADPSKEKIFHAAEYDVMTLRRDFGFTFANLFDTMWAARILGWPQVGLGSILSSSFNVHTDKRYQRHDWGKRPLEPQAQIYACRDTHFLLPLRNLQSEVLKQRGRWEEALEVFSQLTELETPARTFDPQSFWRIKGASKLPPRQQAILYQLNIWRDQEARRRDCPPFKVLGDATLMTVAALQPRSTADLSGIRGFRPHHIHRYGDQILRAVMLAARSKPPQPPPPPPRHTRAEMQRYRNLREWRKERGLERGVDPDVIAGNSVLWSLAEQNPSTVEDMAAIEGLGPWRRATYGADLLKVLRNK
jgi:ribonuclease D